MGATNILDRVAASVGLLAGGVEAEFQPAKDVSCGGVLCAIPSLMACGLFHKTPDHFPMVKRGYYRLEHFFLVLAIMALCRLKSVEPLHYVSPGEWGKLLGLDRIPEVRTLRQKIRWMVDEGNPQAWSADLCASWMSAAPEDAMVLYVDGHVRVYHGYQAKLPKHYVPRQRLCLHATTDYWVNAMDGQPFFVVNCPVDPGLVQVLEKEIVPRLLNEVPHQPTDEALSSDPLLHRFKIVFDREGYSPGLFLRLKEKRIACLTYRKFPQGDWPDDEFSSGKVSLVSGEEVEMKLAERGTCLTNGLWVREVRRLTESGHQSAILSTDYGLNFRLLAAQMFARWSQENFFRYMREHFGLDKLSEHVTEEMSETTQVVNPAHRRLDGQVRKKVALLYRARAEFGERGYREVIEPGRVERYQQKKSTLKEKIETLERDVALLKAKRKETPRHISIQALPEEERIKPLAYASKHFIDTIKMIAYRSETAMANLLKETMSRALDTRSLLRSLYRTEADIIPNEEQGTLTVYCHQVANHSNDAAIHALFTELNATNTLFPGTNLRLVFNWGSVDFR